MDQLAFLGAEPKGKRKSAMFSRPPERAASRRPIARVVVDLKTATLDHEFDYQIPERLDAVALPGCRVRVRFGHRLVNGFIVARTDRSDHDGKLVAIKAVLGPPVLTAESLRLARAVAHRYAGTLAEVLRDAIPRRVAAAEASSNWRANIPLSGAPMVSESKASRVSLALPTTSEPVAELIRRLSDHESAVIVVPDQKTIDQFLPALTAAFGDGLAVLSSQESAYDRYHSFLRVVTGKARVVLGTRNAVFAPVAGCPLVVVWNDGDESLGEPRSPGWHAREVAAIRSLSDDGPLLVAGFVQTVEIARLVETGWMQQQVPTRGERSHTPRIISAADQRSEDATSHARIPHFAWDVLRAGLRQGPVLIQVARSGYIPAMACQACGHVAHCPQCEGPIGKNAQGMLSCQWCGHSVESFECVECAGTTLRAVRVGSSRTAEELQAAFPDVPVVVSGAAVGMLSEIDSKPQIVVSTPGAEPHTVGGYAAALLLDGDALLARSDLRTEEQTLRRWFTATSLVRDRQRGGVVAVTANPHHRCVQALVRADPTTWARTEYIDREEARLPPSVRSASLSGPSLALQAVLEAVTDRQPSWRVLGPVATIRRSKGVDVESVRSVILVPMSAGQSLADRIAEVRRDDKLKAAAELLRIRMDPISLAADP